MREQAWIGLGDDTLLHSAGEERGPGELDVTHARTSHPPCLLLAWRFARDGDHAFLGDEYAVAQDIVLAQIEQTVEQAHERGTELAPVGGEPVEPLPFCLSASPWISNRQ